MKSPAELERFLKQEGLLFYPVHISDNALSIEIENVDILIDFIKNHNIDTVFYEYSYINQDDLIINEDRYSEFKFDNDMITLLQPQIDKYNNIVETLDYSKPISLCLYAVYCGTFVFTCEYDYWFENEGIDLPNIYIMELATKYFDRYTEKKELTNKKLKEQQEKIYNYIINDEEFHKCTNMSLRRRYVNLLMERRPDIYKVLSQYLPIMEFIENIWRDYKNNRILH